MKITCLGRLVETKIIAETNTEKNLTKINGKGVPKSSAHISKNNIQNTLYSGKLLARMCILVKTAYRNMFNRRNLH